MIAIISPAKNMKPAVSSTPPFSIPVFLHNTQQIVEKLRTYTPWELQSLMHINEKIALDSMERYHAMNFDNNGTSAIETYDGIQYKYMNIHSLTKSEKNFAQNHIRILSGAYGVLKPYDSIYEYRLEMLTKLPLGDTKSLYHYWKNRLYQEITKEDRVIINLASTEYSKCIQNYLTDKDRFITCTFKVMNKGRYKVLATAAKMARGQMVEYIIKNKINSVKGIQSFTRGGFFFHPEESTNTNLVFLQK
jgi:cytoplasmic iron level regulating protein YaaA (DUF328/UPF0246 family)